MVDILGSVSNLFDVVEWLIIIDPFFAMFGCVLNLFGSFVVVDIFFQVDFGLSHIFVVDINGIVFLL